jgi:predicted esterase
MTFKRWAAAVFALSTLAAAPAALRDGVVFTDYPALADASELARRALSPLTVVEMRRMLAASGKSLTEPLLDLSNERYLLYVPPRAPPGGYGVLVFVSPSGDARLPEGWASVLDRLGFIFVSASRSGNDADVFTRRAPLALVAEQNLAQRYPIDPGRVFVGGFSGGAHVALRLALAYPDVFAGALLDAGSDPIGDHADPLPPAELFERFQTRTRLVYVTGSRDQARLAMDSDSLSSMRHWCVAGAVADQIPDAGHQVADPAALTRALLVLQTPVKADAARLAACRAGLDREMDRAFDDALALAAAGRAQEAREALIRLDARFGGLAAPRSLALAERLAAR